jgi:hypothetical protein
MLAQATRGVAVAAHSPADIVWDSLESPCIVAMHWHRTDAFHAFLSERGFDVAVMVRNPLDVLISILHFSQYEPATANWLEGEGGDERSLLGADPASPEFLDYALSRRAALLLKVSAEWHSSARHVVRYERLVADPVGTLDLALRRLGCTAAAPDQAVRENTIERMRTFSRHHFWRGEPGVWQRLIPSDYRRTIYERHRDVFELWGYERPDEGPLSPALARQNWNLVCVGDKP